MAISQEQIIFVIAFIVIALASWRIGEFLTRFKLPLISGYLFAGIVVGPFGLNLITEEALGSLRVIDELSLAVIAFAAGSELYYEGTAPLAEKYRLGDGREHDRHPHFRRHSCLSVNQLHSLPGRFAPVGAGSSGRTGGADYGSPVTFLRNCYCQ
ncbi:MAG: hypothetical protein HF973_12425 [Chloroflexi bacterium]|nr:hypothetical protein [Chloroflexota bacterium]